MKKMLTVIRFTGRRSKLAAQTSREWLVDHCPVAGEPGKEKKFKFHYRSLSKLDSSVCIESGLI